MSTATAPKLLTKAEIRERVLSAVDRTYEYVDAWGITLRVASLTGTQRDKYQNSQVVYGRNAKGLPTIEAYNPINAPARLVALSVVDEDGELVFSEVDVLALGDKNPIELERVADVARRLSKLTADSVEAAKAGLKTTQNGTHGSV